MLFATVFEIIDWIRHYDPHGKLKYKFYNTFLYGDGLYKSDYEKKELIKEMHRITRSKFVKLIHEHLTTYDYLEDDGKEEAIMAVASALADFAGVSHSCEVSVMALNNFD